MFALVSLARLMVDPVRPTTGWARVPRWGMAAFLILTYDVLDAPALSSYRAAATQALLGPDAGELVVSTDRTEHLPEAGSAGTHTVVLKYRDAAHARRVYESTAYQAVIGDRLAATVPRVAMIVPDVP